MKKDSCLAYWESKYLLEFLCKINDLINDIGAPQKCFGRYKSMWQTRRNVYANGSRDCNSNSSVYPNKCTEERAALQLKKVQKKSQRKDQKAQCSCNKSCPPAPLPQQPALCLCQQGHSPTRRAICSGDLSFLLAWQPKEDKLLFKCWCAEGRAWRTLTFSGSH